MTEFLIVVCIIWLTGLTLILRGMILRLINIDKEISLIAEALDKQVTVMDIHKEQIDLSHKTLKVVYKILSDMKGVALKQPEA